MYISILRLLFLFRDLLLKYERLDIQLFNTIEFSYVDIHIWSIRETTRYFWILKVSKVVREIEALHN